jgi:hypothetical protein
VRECGRYVLVFDVAVCVEREQMESGRCVDRNRGGRRVRRDRIKE